MLLTGCAGVLVVAFRRLPGRSLRPVLLTAWVASGSTFAWGSWTLFASGLTTRVPDLDHAIPGIVPLIYSVQVISSLLLLVVGTLTMIERAAPRADVESVG
jgi:TRAP-type C4-dicarboxylate transport system permease small subunit